MYSDCSIVEEYKESSVKSKRDILNQVKSHPVENLVRLISHHVENSAGVKVIQQRVQFMSGLI